MWIRLPCNKVCKGTEGNSLVALFTFLAALAAMGATWISKINLDEELNQFVVWKGGIQSEGRNNNKYKALL